MAFDPTLEVPRGPLSRLVGLLASAVFLGADLHLHVLVAISDSFLRVPAGAMLDPLNATYTWLDLGGVMIHAGFRLAAPIIAFVFLMNVFIAVLTRLAPSMNLYFSLGFIVSIFGGEFVLLVSLPTMLQSHLDLVHETLNRIPEILEQVGGGALGR
jgi:flagellar biosynthetic protein FliR